MENFIDISKFKKTLTMWILFHLLHFPQRHVVLIQHIQVTKRVFLCSGISCSQPQVDIHLYKHQMSEVKVSLMFAWKTVRGVFEHLRLRHSSTLWDYMEHKACLEYGPGSLTFSANTLIYTGVNAWASRSVKLSQFRYTIKFVSKITHGLNGSQMLYALVFVGLFCFSVFDSGGFV